MAIDRVMTVTRPPLYILLVIGLLAVSAGLAVMFGYISPDSWYYIFLAQSLRAGHGFSLHHEYMAVYPCGYPTILALTAPLTSLAGFMVSSKLTNWLLLSLSFLFALRASKNLFVATLVVINPVTLLIGMFTWSENLLLFCVCGIWLALSELQANPRNRWAYAGLAACLIIGCFTRYFFGPFAFLLFLSAWVAYGRAMALRIFPLFCVAGVIFLAYQKFNLDTTGYTTGMPRVPAPETALLLIRQFLMACGASAVIVGLAAGLLVGLSYGKVRIARETSPASTFIILAGLGFLALAFVLRLHTLFDPFGTRTIGYGIVLLIAGLVGRYVHLNTEDRTPQAAHLAAPQATPLAALLICGIFSVLFADGLSLPHSLNALWQGHYAFPAASLPALQGPKPTPVVVMFDLPVAVLDSGDVDNVSEIYYGPDTQVFSPQVGPDNTPETPQAFWGRLGNISGKACVFDFTPYASLTDFNTYLDSKTLVDHRFRGPLKTVERANFDPQMQAWLRRVFRPAQRVPCADIPRP